MIPVRTQRTQSIDSTLVADLELVERVVGGDKSAFEVLYARYAPAVWRRLKRLAFSREDAQDLLQQTFLEAYRAIARYRPEGSLESWLHGIAFHVAANHIKARRRKWWQLLAPQHTNADGDQAPMIERSPSQRPSPEEQAENRELVAQMVQLLEAMPLKKRVAFCLYQFEGLALADIGQLVNASAQTVWARVESVRKELHEKLGYGDPSDSS